MTHITSSVKATYDVERIKQLIVADMKHHGFQIEPDDIQTPDYWSNMPLSSSQTPFTGFEIRKDVPVAPPLPKPTMR